MKSDSKFNKLKLTKNLRQVDFQTKTIQSKFTHHPQPAAFAGCIYILFYKVLPQSYCSVSFLKYKMNSILFFSTKEAEEI
ncbi:hypothetical protein LFU01_33200 [Lysinibacillus fusiformis]|nr:hypothetical protein LFU01_33200 [Lysinibacillus fusiformis]